MTTFVPVSRERHGAKRWKRYPDYRFAAPIAAVPLLISELAKAAPVLPVAFIPNGEGFVPAAVLGTVPGQNLFVDPLGRWIGPYVPAAFRAHPFTLAPMADGREVLCIDEDSGLVTDDPEGEPFFDPDGAPSKATATALAFLEQLSSHRKRTQIVSDVLKEHSLIQSWPFAINTPLGEVKIAGLYGIDEAALNGLPGEAFLKLREAGCLPVAYLQLLAMQNMPKLGAGRSHSAALPQGSEGGQDHTG